MTRYIKALNIFEKFLKLFLAMKSESIFDIWNMMCYSYIFYGRSKMTFVKHHRLESTLVILKMVSYKNSHINFHSIKHYLMYIKYLLPLNNLSCQVYVCMCILILVFFYNPPTFICGYVYIHMHICMYVI